MKFSVIDTSAGYSWPHIFYSNIRVCGVWNNMSPVWKYSFPFLN